MDRLTADAFYPPAMKRRANLKPPPLVGSGDVAHELLSRWSLATEDLRSVAEAPGGADSVGVPGGSVQQPSERSVATHTSTGGKV